MSVMGRNFILRFRVVANTYSLAQCVCRLRCCRPEFLVLIDSRSRRSESTQMQDWHAYAKILTALIVIADPVGAVPFFLSLTDRHSVEERRHTAKVTATTVALVLVVAVFFGKPLLEIFGITIASFRVAGGTPPAPDGHRHVACSPDASVPHDRAGYPR